MTYKITQKCIDLVEELFSAGYRGEAKITNSYASGANTVLDGAFSIELSGFCKETLCITGDVEADEIVFVGRYNREWSVEPSAEGVVNSAWNFYKSYNDRGYSLPYEFEALFKKYGYLVEKKVPAKTVWEEA